jgi:hypothetical protein
MNFDDHNIYEGRYNNLSDIKLVEKNNFIYPNRYNNLTEVRYNTSGYVPLFFFGLIINF